MKFRNLRPVYQLTCRQFAAKPAIAQAAAKHERLPQEDLKTSQLSSGLTVMSLENQTPVSRVVIVTRAGARHEDETNPGIVHCLRNAAGLTSEGCTTFAITKNIEWVGANMRATATRDYLIYTLECHRDHAAHAIKYLNDTVFRPSFKPWELSDSTCRLKRDLVQYSQDQSALMMEALHKVAFRGGLSNSLFMDEYRVGSHKSEQLRAFCKSHVTGPRTVISAVGVDHERLMHVCKQIEGLPSTSSDDSGMSKFIGGHEARIPLSAPNTTVALAVEGAGMRSPKEMMTLEVLKYAYGTGGCIPYSESAATPLGAGALSAKPQHPFGVSAFNAVYEDTGLFGVSVAADRREITAVTKSVVVTMRNLGKSISQQQVDAAKSKLRRNVLGHARNGTRLATLNALQHLTQGKAQSLDAVESLINEVTASDVSAMAARVSKMKPALAVVGKLETAPHIEDLL